MAAVPDVGRATRVESQVAPEATATQDLYERYSGQLLGYCFNKLGSREEAEDAVQQTFLNAFRGLKRGIVPEAESAWLFKIAENVCLTRRRSSFRRGRVETPGDIQALQEYVAAPQRMGTDELIQLQKALVGMPATQRKAILLREWQGLSYREIADEMGLTQPAVETLIFRARRSLAEGLERPEERTTLLARLRHGLDLASLAGAFKALLAGSTAAKAVATTAAAVTAAGAVVAAAPEPRGHEAPLQPGAKAAATSERRAAAAPTVVAARAASGRADATPRVEAPARTSRPASSSDATASQPQPAAGTAHENETPTAPATAPAAEPSAAAPTHASASAQQRSANGDAPSGKARALGKDRGKAPAEKPTPASAPKAAPETAKANGPEAKPDAAAPQPGPPTSSELPPSAQAGGAEQAEAKLEKPEKLENEPQGLAKGKA